MPSTAALPAPRSPADAAAPPNGARAMAAPKRRGTLRPPPGGAVVRMYRIGHGDCFLLAFDGEQDTVFVLIDCGYKPGSAETLGTTPDQVVDDIREATGGRIDVAVITHEHQDHVNAITQKRFKDIAIDQTWLAWTESASDEVARRLRARYRDRLKALVQAYSRLAGAPAGESLAELLALQIGGEEETPAIAALGFAANGRWTNKDAMKLFRDRAAKGTRFLYPHEEILPLPGAPSVRVFPLGPPRDEDALRSLDPEDGEGFGEDRHLDGGAFAFFAAALAGSGSPAERPFAPRFGVPRDRLADHLELAKWYAAHYGPLPGAPAAAALPAAAEAQPVKAQGPMKKAKARTQELRELADDAAERRIETEWLLSAGALALDMADETNNGSLVLAFELGKSGKVLLFAGDAQRGNWVSWAGKTFKDGQEAIEVRDLLGRTVLYKVGHHGSHNATLKGAASDPWPNLAWLGQGRYADEFTAMVTAVRVWAMGLKTPWDHPLPAIRAALLEKCGSRVLQTDTPPDLSKLPRGVDGADWAAFGQRVTVEALYFDCRILP